MFAALARSKKACLIKKRLSLTKEWCEDQERCQAAGIPDIYRTHRNNAELALEIIEDADRDGALYGWVGMDAEFGNYPQLLTRLDDEGKSFIIDIKRNTFVYQPNPKLLLSPKSLSPESRLRLRKRALAVEKIVQQRGKRKWRTTEIRDSTKGAMSAEFLHKRVWFKDGRPECKPWHLLIRRTQRSGDWLYKFSLSNAPYDTSTQVLAFQRSQRFWIEQALRDAKDGLGLDE